MTVRCHVACAVAGAYDAHSAVMLRSLATSAGGAALHVHYLHGGDLAPRSRRRISAMLEGLGCAVTFHAIAPEETRDLPVVGEFTAAMWYRILLPELLPGVDRILYLDVDTLVLEPVTPLWELDLDGSYLAAVDNVLLTHHRHRPAAIGLDPTTAYFNSGVLLMNLALMRQDGCTARLRERAIRDAAKLEWPDQDVLNLVLGERRVALHPRWNCMNSLWAREAVDVFAPVELEEARARPALRHFEGPGANKPWHAACRVPHADVYFEHRRRSPWPRCRRTGTPRERGRRVLQALGSAVLRRA